MRRRGSIQEHLLAAGVDPSTLARSDVREDWATRVAVNTALLLLCAVFVLPLLWVILASLDSRASWDLALPDLTLDNFDALLTARTLRPFGNSLYVSGLAALTATAAAIPAGYSLSRRRVPLQRTWLLAILFASSLPITMAIVPTYQMFAELKWLNSLFFISLFLAATSLPFSIWLVKGFIDQVPIELDEAAEMEGASSVRTLVSVIVPLILPGIGVAAILTFLNAWNAFLVPLVLNSDPNNNTAAVAIYEFLPRWGTIQYGQLAAYSLLYSLPVVLMYAVMARRLSGAFAFTGGVKG
jgi:multiple sugar transport system permease protein